MVLYIYMVLDSDHLKIQNISTGLYLVP
jgi:hypothetical protein